MALAALILSIINFMLLLALWVVVGKYGLAIRILSGHAPEPRWRRAPPAP